MTQPAIQRNPLHAAAYAVEAARQRFQAHLARQALAARLDGHVSCPLFPDVTVEHGGDVYAVTWFEVGGFDTMSRTAIYEVQIIRHRDGQRTEYRVIRKERRRKSDGHTTVRYDSAAGKADLQDTITAALVALAGSQPVCAVAA